MTNHIDFFSTVIQPVFEAYQSNKTKRTLNTRIYRGRAPSVSPIYENSVAEFIDQFFQDIKNLKIFVDTRLNINAQKNIQIPISSLLKKMKSLEL